MVWSLPHSVVRSTPVYTFPTEDETRQALSDMAASMQSVNELEDSIANLSHRLVAAENIGASASPRMTELDKHIFDLENQGAVFKQYADEYAALDESINMSIKKANHELPIAAEIENTSAKLAFGAEQMVGQGEIKGNFGLCVEAVDRNLQGSKVRMWTCLKGQKNQMWSVGVGKGIIRNRDGICIDAPGVTTDTMSPSDVVMWGCNEETFSMQWTYDPATKRVTNYGSNECLRPVESNTRGSNLMVAPCDLTDVNQNFNIVAGSDGMMQKLEVINTKIWDVADPSSNMSAEAIDKHVSEIKEKQDEFEAEVGSTVKKALVQRFRGGVRKMRQALEEFRTPENYGEPVPTPEFGTDIGLGGA